MLLLRALLFAPAALAVPHALSEERSVFPQLTWLRDTVIEKVFGVPAKEEIVPEKQTSALPSNLLAKYGGDVVLRFNLSTAEEERALAEVADALFLDVWEFTQSWVDIRLRDDDVPVLLGLLPTSLQGAYSNLMPDLAQAIHQTYSPENRLYAFTSTPSPAAGDNIFFHDYQPLSVIVPWMKLMASMFTTHVRMVNIGLSYEGRDILALRVGVHPGNEPRKTILVVGGTHAREWISTSTVCYLAWSLITSYGKSSGFEKLLQEFDWVFVPVLNVDGYVYTWENDRLWRKNRQQTNLRFCRGLDLDRGFGFKWDGTSYQSNPCSESYPGDEPFQAVESHRLADWAKRETKEHNVTFVGFLDLHSYSQQVLYPYSYTCDEDPPSLENLMELALGITKAIRLSSGTPYGVVSACEGAVKGARLETGGGSAIDWFYHEMKVRYSYQIKLRDMGSYGFLLPADQIVPTGEEIFNAVKYFGDFLLSNKGIESRLWGESVADVMGIDEIQEEVLEVSQNLEREDL